MYMVTGGAGFIGSHLVKSLNDTGSTDIMVVDDLSNGAKFSNLADCQVADYLDKDELAAGLIDGSFECDLKAIFHQGACTDTMEYDGQYMMQTNFTFSKLLLEYALSNSIPFIYASSAATYGASRNSEVTEENERPLNVYGYSKLCFDQYVRNRMPQLSSTVVGLRYFNVYGPREVHKGAMASMVYQLYRQIMETGKACLFEGTDGFDDGEQKRDFVFVDDLIKVNRFFAEKKQLQGIVNVGTGRARSFNEVARSLFKLLRKPEKIEYIPFDKTLEGKYQSFTKADLSGLRKSGYDAEFTPLETGVAASVTAWQK